MSSTDNLSVIVGAGSRRLSRRRPVALAAGFALAVFTARDAAALPARQGPVVAGDTVATAPRKATSTATQRRSRSSSRRPAARNRVSRGEVVAARAPVLTWNSPVGTEALATELSAALAQYTRRGTWGVMVVSLSKGDTLFASNPDGMMQPASTMKMYTAAVALDKFGPEFQYQTSVLRDGEVSPDGSLQGSLYLRGDGDPSLSPRLWGDVNPMDSLARQVAASGIKHVHGDVVADASAFDNRLVPEGWQTRYLGAAYAARVSALSLNENIVWVVVEPNGKQARVSLDPATTTVPVESAVRVVAGSRGRIVATRRGDGVIQVRGTIGARSGPLRYSLVVDDPPAFTAGALRAALEKAGVAVDGRVNMGVTPASASPVASVASPPLGSIIAEMNRESINLYAELLFRSAARAATPGQVGSAETGLSTLRTFMADKVGARPAEIEATDGSGLSVLDRVTPRSMVELLSYAHRAPWGATFHASLPVEGESGTLRGRARHTPARGNLHAKTGTTNTVASLGGYVTAKNGEILAFSFLYNGTDRWNARLAMDRMGATMAEFVRD